MWAPPRQGDALQSAEAQQEARLVIPPGELERVRDATRPPSAIDDVTVRWGTLNDARSCQRYEEMHEVLRRSDFMVERAPSLHRDAFGVDALEVAIRARVEAITGKPWTARDWPWRSEHFAFGYAPERFVKSMTDHAWHCPIDTLSKLRDEVAATTWPHTPKATSTRPSGTWSRCSRGATIHLAPFAPLNRSRRSRPPPYATWSQRCRRIALQD